MIDTRLQLHWAAQAAAGVGRTVLPKQADDSHTNFRWREGSLMQGDDRSGIRIRDLTLLFGDDEYPLTGRTLDDAFRFFEERVGQTLARPGEAAPPDHPVAHGAVFVPAADELKALSALYARANDELQRVQESPVRCWPHHLDIATLIALGGGRTIGVGLSPGDTQYPAPYWYVNTWPEPDEHTMTPLPGGFWNTQGWYGAVLPALSNAKVAEFIDAAISGLRR